MKMILCAILAACLAMFLLGLAGCQPGGNLSVQPAGATVFHDETAQAFPDSHEEMAASIEPTTGPTAPQPPGPVSVTVETPPPNGETMAMVCPPAGCPLPPVTVDGPAGVRITAPPGSKVIVRSIRTTYQEPIRLSADKNEAHGMAVNGPAGDVTKLDLKNTAPEVSGPAGSASGGSSRLSLTMLAKKISFPLAFGVIGGLLILAGAAIWYFGQSIKGGLIVCGAGVAVLVAGFALQQYPWLPLAILGILALVGGIMLILHLRKSATTDAALQVTTAAVETSPNPAAVKASVWSNIVNWFGNEVQAVRDRIRSAKSDASALTPPAATGPTTTPAPAAVIVPPPGAKL
jgi:hypothetical protein